LNISTRLRVDNGDKVMIGGFIIRGNASKPVVLRGIGPSLVNAGIPAALVLNDPVLELHGPNGALITSNDNWKDSPQRSQIEGTIFQPTDDRESVILATLPPAAYTVILKGVGQTTGVGLIEVYDNNQALDSDLANISTRGLVESGDNVLIGGIISSKGLTKVVVRAIGPTLASFGITNPLLDPTLELYDDSGTQVAMNDDWQTSQKDDIEEATLAPNDSRESAIFAALPAGNYTAVVRGKNGATGVAVVEAYNLAPGVGE